MMERRRAARPATRGVLRPALRAILAAACAGLALACSAEDESTGPPSLARLTLSVPEPPTPVAAGDSVLLVHELLIENGGPVSVGVDEVVVAAQDGAALAELDGNRLASRMESYSPNRTGRRTPTRVIEAGELAVIHLWIALRPADVPDGLRHSVTFAGDGQILVRQVALAPAAEPPVALGPPLPGDRWLTTGLSNESAHRRAVLFFDGVPRLAQRLAIDWARVGTNGARFAGDPSRNESWLAWGADALAVADGTVLLVRDDVAENVPGQPPEEGAPLAGNHVLLDLGGGRQALYAHLIPGSITVQAGDAVSRGDPLGRVGNSGASGEPHLHFHVARVFDPASPSTLDASGLPFVLESYEVLEGPPAPGVRSREIPLEGSVISFPAP